MSIAGNLKRTLAEVGDRTGLSRLGLEYQKRTRMPFIRALNYHDVPSFEAERFEAQLALYSKHFQPVGLDELLTLAAGRWSSERPGLIISFDDGLASNAQVAAPLLEKYGFIGWFMVPTGFIDAPPSEQVDYARVHSINVRGEPGPDGRIAMSWDELRNLVGSHVIGCHTVDHVRFSDRRSSAELERETIGSRERLQEQLGISIDVFAWVGGEEDAYSAQAAAMIRKAGFRVALMTNNSIFRPGDDLMQLDRTNIETHYSPALTRLHLSGFYDLLYAPKRRRVRALTRTA